MIGWLIAHFASWGLPEPLRKVAAWATVVVAVLALLWAGKAIYDASVIADHEKDRAVESMDAHDDAAEARASDGVRDILNDKERTDAIESAPSGGSLSAPELRLNCERLRQIGRKLPAACGH